MKETKNAGKSGVGVTGLLQVAFIVLKLCEVINWSWWWVLSPSWISFCLVVLLLCAHLILAAVAESL